MVSEVNTRTVTGGRAVVEAMLAAGVDHAFLVPGESFLGVLDALYDEPRIRVVATRHEGGAAFMAEAYGKLTRRPATCMGTRMVGAGNLAIGIHTARQDSTPMIAIFGQVSTRSRYREAFQESELSDVFTPVVKWAIEPPSAERLAELTFRAARVAVYGRPGPVAIALREDLLSSEVESPTFQPIQLARPAPDPTVVKQVLQMIRFAEQPLMLLGGGVLAAGASELYVRLAEAEGLSVVAAWRRPDVFPNDHPLYLGMTGLGSPSSVRSRVFESDLLLVVGTRLNEYTTFEYSAPGTDTRLVHVDVSAEGLGGHRQADVGCVADAALFAEALLAAGEREPASGDLLERRRDGAAVDRSAWESQTVPARGKARAEYVDQQAVVAHLRELLPRDAITTTDAGNFSGWPARYLRWNQPGTFLGPTSGAMGYAIPAAIGAKLARPDQKVVAFVGDGGFLMTGTELETAARERAPVVVLVYDNAQYGTIRMHQERDHPGRQVGTALGPVDFAAFGRSLGGLGFTIREEREFPGAFKEALAADVPSVLHIRVDPEQISVGTDQPQR